jgi:hypothetical protein
MSWNNLVDLIVVRRGLIGCVRALALIMVVRAAAAPVLAASDAVPQRPTFAKDIAPIFQDKCEVCHRGDSIAPMSLVTYEESRPWARSIRARVAAGQMPPWHIDKTVGIQDFKNDRSLSDGQRETILRWVDQGSARGNLEDMPPAKRWPNEQGWPLATTFGQTEPDMIIRSAPWTQKAGANDAWWRPVVETGITEPRWVRAIEIRPGSVKGRKITHHALARLQQYDPDTPEPQREPTGTINPDDPNIGAGLFMEWAVGKQGEVMRPNVGKLLLPGSRISWEVHYSNGGEDITDVVELGLYFYPKGQTPRYRQVLHLMGPTLTRDVDIPPNTVKVSEGFFTLRQHGRVESFQPHMHLRGKAMSMEAILPNGRSRILSHVADFSFNWHNSYVYADGSAPLLPKGTILKITAWHDNTAANKANPDPNVWVGYGDRTVDEMAHAWVNVTYLSDPDYLDEIEKRKTTITGTAPPPGAQK